VVGVNVITVCTDEHVLREQLPLGRIGVMYTVATCQLCGIWGAAIAGGGKTSPVVLLRIDRSRATCNSVSWVTC